MSTLYYQAHLSVKNPEMIVSESGAGMVYYHFSSFASFE